MQSLVTLYECTDSEISFQYLLRVLLLTLFTCSWFLWNTEARHFVLRKWAQRKSRRIGIELNWIFLLIEIKVESLEEVLWYDYINIWLSLSLCKLKGNALSKFTFIDLILCTYNVYYGSLKFDLNIIISKCVVIVLKWNEFSDIWSFDYTNNIFIFLETIYWEVDVSCFKSLTHLSCYVRFTQEYTQSNKRISNYTKEII